MKIWKFLTTDIRELNLKQAEDVTKVGTDAAKAAIDLAKTVNEQGSKDEILKKYVGQISSLLDVLNSPLAQVVKDTIPFAPLAVGIVRLIAEATKKEVTIEQCMFLVSQTAYLESMRSLLKPYVSELEQKEQKSQAKASEAIARHLKELGDKEFTEKDAKDALLSFPTSKLAKEFNQILQVRLQETGFSETKAEQLSDRIAWNTNQFIHTALSDNADSFKSLTELHRNGGRVVLERYASIEKYLDAQIRPLPDQIIFQEESASSNDLRVTYRELYVPLKAQLLDANGRELKDTRSISLEDWIVNILRDPNKTKPLMFIQGEAGRGKSVFCRMFAEAICNSLPQSLYPSYIPILIRLRGLRALENRLQDTLENSPELQNCDFVTSDSGWLTDETTRFLFLLDGFDELLLEGRATGGLQEFLQQVEQFQQNSHHRFVITGRPLALLWVEKLISQIRNIKRIELLPMDNALTQYWLQKWTARAGETETQMFWQFLEACPKDVQNLAREPLLMYLLARMHREPQEPRLSVQMFTEAEGIYAKIKIYDAVIKWVLNKQRQQENLRITGLDPEELRQFLTEAATCVVQSGNEVARVSMLEARLMATHNPAAELLKKSRQETNLDDSKTLNNLLTSFYIKPASGEKGGSIEFVHKSFGEFLFAERLQAGLTDWAKIGGRRKNEFLVPDREMHREFYDLLGYGGLTPEIVSYLTPRLVDALSEQDLITLFQRLNNFYDLWCDGEFIDADPPTLSQKTMRMLKESGVQTTGQRQVDVYTGLNVLILLLELHRYAQNQNNLKDKVIFYPTGQHLKAADELKFRLSKIIYYSNSIDLGTFTNIAGLFLASANLASANLTSADLAFTNLTFADLTSTDLAFADLTSANLTSVNLTSANLTSANLAGTNFTSANLAGTNFTSANLAFADLTSADLTSAKLTSAKLASANLASANFTSADLSFTNLAGTNFTSANLTFADLTSADLDSANLTSANLTSANLTSANLTSAKLTFANLTSAKLASANLASANFAFANLAFANLASTNLYGANLRHTVLLTTDLRDTKNLTQHQLEGENHPLVCNVALPKGINVNPNRDCDLLLEELVKRYPEAFANIEDAKQYMDEARQKKWE